MSGKDGRCFGRMKPLTKESNPWLQISKILERLKCLLNHPKFKDRILHLFMARRIETAGERPSSPSIKDTLWHWHKF